MSDPFAVAVGMVLQRNWKEHPGNICDIGGFNQVLGEYCRVVSIDEPFAECTILSHWGLYIGFFLNMITAEWFIPD